MPVAKLGSEADIIIGRTVIAIGNPLSLSLMNSASIGIISGVNRSADSPYCLIQTDAAINPGNSGGPLVNLKGEAIGINSSKYIGNGIEGMGFSIPVNTVKYIMDQFDRYGKVRRPYMGTVFEEGWAAKIGLPSQDGLRIVAIEDGSPAKNQGLMDGDVLYDINGVNINSLVDLNEEMKKYSPETKVKILIKRDGRPLTIEIKLAEAN